MKSAIKVKDLYFGYTDDMVIDGVSFEIREQEFVSVIGPNGSGKTTLLKLLYGEFPSQSGHVSLRDKPIREIKRTDLARQMGVVSQEYPLQMKDNYYQKN